MKPSRLLEMKNSLCWFRFPLSTQNSVFIASFYLQLPDCDDTGSIFLEIARINNNYDNNTN
jgi:hypothetical protein